MTRQTRMAGLVLWKERPGLSDGGPRIVATVIDPEVVVFSARIAEEHVATLAVGQACQIELPALSHGRLSGKVASIGITAEDMAITQRYGQDEEHQDSGRQAYEVRIELEAGGRARLYQGMTGKAFLAAGRPEEHVVIPRACVWREGSRSLVLVREGEQWLTRAITIAVQDERDVAVASGLAPGEEVAIPAE